jgi:putative phosphonate metabolism protein
MFSPDARVAVYYAPQPDDVLSLAAAAWLGRDPESDMPVPQPDFPNIAEVTAEPRLYGFHATLKPPMRLAEGCRWSDVVAAASDLADRTAPFDLPRLAVSDVFGFLALRETVPCPPLQALADACVERLDPFRAPTSEAELARRRRANLTARQDAMLVRWGYPYVFDTWFFHMTLTRRLNAEEKGLYQAASDAHLAYALTMPRRVTDICLFVQPAPGEAFVIEQRLTLRG